MISGVWPWPFVNDLIDCFDLNECEAADLSDRAQRCLDYGMSRAALVQGLWMRVDILVNRGSPMQATWNTVKLAAFMGKRP